MQTEAERFPEPASSWKGKPLRMRLGFAAAGFRVVFRREKSFRTQILLGFAAASACFVLEAGLLWSALVALAIALVLALELMNAALEYLTDHLHPSFSGELGRAKDAAAGAVLVASFGAAVVGALMVVSALLR